MNNLVKTAFDAGVNKCLEDFGLVKQANRAAILSALGGGALGGAGAGLATEDDDDLLRNILLGTGGGAALGGGGAKLMQMLRGGGQKAFPLPPKVLPGALEDGTKISNAKAHALAALGGGVLGGGAAGLATEDDDDLLRNILLGTGGGAALGGGGSALAKLLAKVDDPAMKMLPKPNKELPGALADGTKVSNAKQHALMSLLGAGGGGALGAAAGGGDLDSALAGAGIGALGGLGGSVGAARMRKGPQEALDALIQKVVNSETSINEAILQGSPLNRAFANQSRAGVNADRVVAGAGGLSALGALGAGYGLGD